MYFREMVSHQQLGNLFLHQTNSTFLLQGSLSFDRQKDAEERPFALYTFSPDRTSQQFHQFQGKRKPKARSFNSLFIPLLHPVIAIEDMGQGIFRDARTVILNSYFKGIGLRRGRNQELHDTSPLGIFQCVGKKVREELYYFLWIIIHDKMVGP